MRNPDTASGAVPVQLIYDALQRVPNLGKWTYDVHQVSSQ